MSLLGGLCWAGRVRGPLHAKAVEAAICGFHLTNPMTRKLVGNPAVQRVFSGHCMEKAAFELRKRERGEKLDQLEVGKQNDL